MLYDITQGSHNIVEGTYEPHTTVLESIANASCDTHGYKKARCLEALPDPSPRDADLLQTIVASQLSFPAIPTIPATEQAKGFHPSKQRDLTRRDIPSQHRKNQSRKTQWCCLVLLTWTQMRICKGFPRSRTSRWQNSAAAAAGGCHHYLNSSSCLVLLQMAHLNHPVN